MLIGSAVALLLSVIAVAAGGALRGLALAPLALLVAAAALDLAQSLRRRGQLSVDMSPEIFIGETAPLRLTLPAAPVGIRARFGWPEGLSGPAEARFEICADGTAVTEVPCRGVRRGAWPLGTVWLRWVSGWGFFEFVPRLDCDLTVRVVPNIRMVQSGIIATTVQSTLFGVKENRIIGEGTEFHQLREFVRGMDVNTIDWKASAKRRVLMGKELQAERNHNVIIALDTGYLMQQSVAGLPKVDHAATSALAVAWAAAVGGDLVGHFSYDAGPRAFAAPIPGRQAFARLRSWTADLDYSSRETNHTLALTDLNARTPKRSLIIVFTDFIDATSAQLLVENVSLLAKRHLLIFVALRDPEQDALIDVAPDDLNGVAALVATNQSITERRVVLERLSRQGVTVIDANPETVTARLISAYLDIKARELI